MVYSLNPKLSLRNIAMSIVAKEGFFVSSPSYNAPNQNQKAIFMIEGST